MGNIILFENHRKKDRKKYKTPQATESHHSTENLNEFIKYMGLMLQNIPDSPIAETMEQHETETKKNLNRNTRIYYQKHLCPVLTEFHILQM